MNAKPPKMRRHATGQWMVRWGGQDRYLGRDRSAAETAYLVEIQQWAQWRAQRETKRYPPMRKVFYVAELVEMFLGTKEAAGGPDLRRYYEKHLQRFARGYGDVRASVINPPCVQAVKDEMLRHGYAPKTVNHDLTAIKALLDWSAGMGHIEPISLKAVRKCPLGFPPDKSLPFSTVCRMMRDATDELRPWLALTYNCLMRPSETIRVVRRQGHWVEPGVYRIKGKMDHRASFPRHVVFNESALCWLEQAKPHWSRLDSFSAAVRRVLPYGPGRLRTSAATHLAQQGVSREEIDLLLGHTPGRVSLTYTRISWPHLRASAGRIAL